MLTMSTESMDHVLLCPGLTAPAFLGNDALDDELDDDVKESASENMTRT